MSKPTINASDLKKAITEDGKTRKQLATEYGVSLAELDFILKTFNLNSLKAKRKGRAVKAKFELNDDLKTAPVEVSKKSSPAPSPEPQQEVAPQPDFVVTTSSNAVPEGSLFGEIRSGMVQELVDDFNEELEEVESEHGDEE